jgi:hypothetical protein
MPKVFVSYSHDSEEHKKRVAAFVSRLRDKEGVSVVWDDDLARVGGPDEGWARWCERQIVECEFVLACCTGKYRERFNGEQPPAAGLGVAWEAHLIRQYLYKSGTVNRKVRVLLFDEADHVHVPEVLESYHAFRPANDESYGQLLGWLKGTPAAPTAPTDTVVWPAIVDTFVRRLANRKDEFEFFTNMLSKRCVQRIFLIQGPSSTGKSIFLNECMGYAEHVGVPHAYLSFKGGITLDEALASLLVDLDDTILPESSACPEPARPHRMIADFQRARSPVLLFFDAYEQAPQVAQNWVETQLLQRIARCPALVVVVAGQKVPEQSARHWTDFALTVALSPILRVDDWIDYAGRNFASAPIQRQHVEALMLTNDGDPGRISAVLAMLAQRLAAAPVEPGG